MVPHSEKKKIFKTNFGNYLAPLSSYLSFTKNLTFGEIWEETNLFNFLDTDDRVSSILNKHFPTS